MRNLSKFVAAALVGATALGAALPAQAQSYPRHDGRYDHNDHYDHDRRDYNDQHWGNDRGIRAQIEELQRRIERTDSRDRISEREAAGLRRDVWRLRQQYREYARGGLSRRESQVLQARIHDIRQRLRFERRDDDGRRW
jgi:hypothetical protein